MKLKVYIDMFNPTPSTNYMDLWYESLIWAVTEHGLSLFAASVLAIRPFFTYVSKGISTLSTNLSATTLGTTGKRGSSRVSGISNHTLAHESTELAGIVTRGESAATRRGSNTTTGSLGKHPYSVDMYSESFRTSSHENGNKNIREPGDIV